MSNSDEIFFFGCYRDTGHFLWAPGGVPAKDKALPPSLKRMRLDTTHAPKDAREREGRAAVHHVDGWTVVAWWDRSVDRRHGSNSAFLMKGEHSFSAVLLAAGNAFPELLPRFATLQEVKT